MALKQAEQRSNRPSNTGRIEETKPPDISIIAKNIKSIDFLFLCYNKGITADGRKTEKEEIMSKEPITQEGNQDANINPATAESTKAEGQTNEADKGQKFTQEDMDRVISERLKKAEAKKQGEIDAAVQRAIADYERKAKMTEAERVAEASKQREDELTKRETELAIRENRNHAIEELTKKKIPTSLVDYIATADPEQTDENIANFERDWSRALAEAVKDAAKGSAPRDLSSAESKSSATEKRRGTQVI